MISWINSVFVACNVDCIKIMNEKVDTLLFNFSMLFSCNFLGAFILEPPDIRIMDPPLSTPLVITYFQCTNSKIIGIVYFSYHHKDHLCKKIIQFEDHFVILVSNKLKILIKSSIFMHIYGWMISRKYFFTAMIFRRWSQQ